MPDKLTKRVRRHIGILEKIQRQKDGTKRFNSKKKAVLTMAGKKTTGGNGFFKRTKSYIRRRNGRPITVRKPVSV